MQWTNGLFNQKTSLIQNQIEPRIKGNKKRSCEDRTNHDKDISSINSINNTNTNNTNNIKNKKGKELKQ
jgi:hypothetical protein